MNAHEEMIVGRKGDYRNKASAIREGRAIQADAKKVSQSKVQDVLEVRNRLNAKLKEEREARGKQK